MEEGVLVIGVDRRDVQEAARELYHSLARTMTEQRTVQAQRRRAAVQQLMELADGEKPWTQEYTENILRAGRGRRNFPVAFRRMVGGGPHRCGNPQAYGLLRYTADLRGITARRPRGTQERAVTILRLYGSSQCVGFGTGD